MTLEKRVEAYLALAEKATPGPWFPHGITQTEVGSRYGPYQSYAPICVASADNTLFIAASHEAAVIIREQQAEIERLNRVIKAQDYDYTRAIEERDSLRKDAERYQFLRSDDVEDTGNLPCVYIANQCGSALVETALDAAIDAAIAELESNR